MKHPFEHRKQPLLSKHLCMQRLVFSIALGVGLIVISLSTGMAGYHWFEGLSWIDAFENAAMILSGMGPLAQPQTEGGKFFAGLYALYSWTSCTFNCWCYFRPRCA
ncbi:MAG: hypothetical protein WDA22_15195 [Bacteroidota bacterium]